jgi:hypothetical protein
MTNENSHPPRNRPELKYDPSLSISEKLFNRIRECGAEKSLELFAIAFKRFPREAEELQFPGTYPEITIDESRWFQLIDDVMNGKTEKVPWVEEYKDFTRKPSA